VWRKLIMAAALASLSACSLVFGDFEIAPGGAADAGSGGGADDGGVSGGLIMVSPTTGLVTSESGGKATFTIVLRRKPTSSVAMTLSSSDPGEGSVSPEAVTFTPANWSAPQTVTVTGVDDQEKDGDQTFLVNIAPASSGDPAYAGVDPADVTVVNVDNESAGFTVTPLTGLTTSEAGGMATFTVLLNSPPSDDVTVALSSSNAMEGTVNPASLTFTAANWKAPQTVTVTGVDDPVADGPASYTIVTATAKSRDPSYNGLDPADVSVVNVDNDTAGITVTPSSGLTTTEGGEMATFTVVLNLPPTANVTLSLSSSNTNEGVVVPSLLTFTPLNWNAPQVVTVTGIDDKGADGNQPYTIVTGKAVSADKGYDGLDAVDVLVTNIDNDSPGITVKPASGLVTNESGLVATFTIVLNSRPTDGVKIDLKSSATTEGTVSPPSVTFTTTNWNAPQTVSITGVDDAVADGDQQYKIVTSSVTSNDPGYSGFLGPEVIVTNVDNDSAGITVATSPDGVTTTESGGTATFTIVLNSEPKANVIIAISSSNVKEGTVGPASVTFTKTNWRAPQTITVTGVDDTITDGNQPYQIITAPAVSGDPAYNGRNAPDVAATNTDNDTAGITVSPTTGLVTTEAGGTAAFIVVLNSQPKADVTIVLSSTNTAEGVVSPASVTFTPTNWNAPQTITVTGVDDQVADGSQPYRIHTASAVSTDPSYGGMDARDVSVTNTDNDSAGITVTSAGNLQTTESGGTASLKVALNSKPTAAVTIGVSSSRPSEGTVSPTSVTFTPANWNAPQTVTIKGADDQVADGAQPYRIVTAAATGTDPAYAGIDPPDVNVTNIDNDSAGITVTAGPNLQTTEAGGTATFSIVLNSMPTAPVAIAVSTSNAGEGTVSPASVSFTPSNWNAPKVVTVKGVDDDVADGNQVYTIVTAPATSNDPGYKGINPADVTVTNVDNESAGITIIAAANLQTTEAGGTAKFSIVLNSKPTADVTIPLASSDPGEGTPAPASLVFTPLNWNAPHDVIVTGVNDDIADGNQVYKILTMPAMSANGNYNGLDGPDVTLTNIDNDSAGIRVTAAANLQTTEAPGGPAASFTVVLNSQPTADVTIAVSTSLSSKGTVEGKVAAPNPPSLKFTSANWNSPQTVSVTGVDDDVADGNQLYNVVLGPASSQDNGYSGIDPPDVPVTNIDNDSPGIVVNAAPNLQTTETVGGPGATFTVVLTSKPANFAVNLPVFSDRPTEGKTDVTALVFTTDDWNDASAHKVTITGQEDLGVADGNQQYHIVIGPSSSTDPNYQGIDPADLLVTNLDNDSAAIVVTPTSCTTSEAGTTATFSIGLTSQPTDNVTITLTSSDLGEGTVQGSVTFTPTAWGLTPITVTPVDDLVVDGDKAYTITTGVDNATTDVNYHGMKGSDVSCTNQDNDLP
jgi:hypothetical protein